MFDLQCFVLQKKNLVSSFAECFKRLEVKDIFDMQRNRETVLLFLLLDWKKDCFKLGCNFRLSGEHLKKGRQF
jgi:hypothetical protein